MTDELLRRFLLARCTDTEREAIESLFLTSDAMRNRVYIAEEDLMEAFLEGALAAHEAQRFAVVYGDSVRFKVFRALKALAKKESGCDRYTTGYP